MIKVCGYELYIFGCSRLLYFQNTLVLILVDSFPLHTSLATPHPTQSPLITSRPSSPIHTANSILKHLSESTDNLLVIRPHNMHFLVASLKRKWTGWLKAKLIPESSVWCATGSVNGPLHIQGGGPSPTATCSAASWIDRKILNLQLTFAPQTNTVGLNSLWT